MMDKEGIGTDATISEHIATILKRNYAEKNPSGRFEPTRIGLALVETYMYLDYPLYKPFLRAHMEKECSLICSGVTHFQEVVDSCIGEMRQVFVDVGLFRATHEQVVRRRDQFKTTFVQFLRKDISELALTVASVAAVADERFSLCSQCGGDLALMTQKKGSLLTRFLQCNACALSLPLPSKGTLTPLETPCPVCRQRVLEVQNGTQKYHLCPFCYSHPSSANLPDIESLRPGVQLPCFRCRADCPFARALPEPLGPCAVCRCGTLCLHRLRDSCAVRCSNSSCDAETLFDPQRVQEVSCLDDVCELCRSNCLRALPCRPAGRLRSSAAGALRRRVGDAVRAMWLRSSSLMRRLRARPRSLAAEPRSDVSPPAGPCRAALFPLRARGLREDDGTGAGRASRGRSWERDGWLTSRADVAGADCCADACEEGVRVAVVAASIRVIVITIDAIIVDVVVITIIVVIVNATINATTINATTINGTTNNGTTTTLAATLVPHAKRVLRLRRRSRSLHDEQAGTQPRPRLLQVRQPPAAMQLLPLGRRERKQPRRVVAVSQSPRVRQSQGLPRAGERRAHLLPLREEGTHGEGLSRCRSERAASADATHEREAAEDGDEAAAVQRVSAAGTHEEDVSAGGECGSTAVGLPDGPGSGLRRHGCG